MKRTAALAAYFREAPESDRLWCAALLSGLRGNLYTDFTFAVRHGDDLVPVAKSSSGLTDAEFEEITRWVRAHTPERFGPVRRVSPELVFEIVFEGIQASPRHKSGIALRFPRMARWRRDKPVSEIGAL